jgi:DNA repair protein RadC
MRPDYHVPVYRVALVREGEIPLDEEPITTPYLVADIASKMLADADREHCLVFLLDSKNRMIGVNTVSIGSLNSSLVHPREVFKPAILANACSVVFIHNHPSSDPTPSEMDLDMFKRLRAAGEILGIDLLDAIVVGQGTHYSACTNRVFPATSE